MDEQTGSRSRVMNASLQPAPRPMTGTKASMSLWRLILSDLDRYRVADDRSYLASLILCPGATAGIVYRIGHWLWAYNGRFRLLVRSFYFAYLLLKRLSEIVNSISIEPQAVIGNGLYIVHGGSVHVNGKAVLGTNCCLSHEVTIGIGGRGDKRGTPRIGDRVYIGPGAKLFGPIEIGHDVAIGANAVVTKSLPDCAVAIGIPAQVISYHGSFDFVLYRGMDEDPSRQESLKNLAPVKDSSS